MGLRILFVCHKNIHGTELRGAERSVGNIVRFLETKGHHVDAYDRTESHFLKDQVTGDDYDIVVSWGKAVEQGLEIAEKIEKPFVMMVRFWRNVSPLPAGDLMERRIVKGFRDRKKHLYKKAAAIITNTNYAKGCIERWYPESHGKVYTSYVPIMGNVEPRGDKDGHLTIVTPEIYGEFDVVKYVQNYLPKEKFWVVNTDPFFKRLYESRTVKVDGFVDMTEVWNKTKILLVPCYENDICGTRRVTIEAMRHGVPVLALDRCGMREVVERQFLVRDMPEWVMKIEHINQNWNGYSKLAVNNFMKYDTIGNLETFENILIKKSQWS